MIDILVTAAVLLFFAIRDVQLLACCQEAGRTRVCVLYAFFNAAWVAAFVTAIASGLARNAGGVALGAIGALIHAGVALVTVFLFRSPWKTRAWVISLLPCPAVLFSFASISRELSGWVGALGPLGILVLAGVWLGIIIPLALEWRSEGQPACALATSFAGFANLCWLVFMRTDFGSLTLGT